MRVFLLLSALLVCAVVYCQLPQLSSTDKNSPLILQELSVDVQVLGNKSVTTFTMTFHNPSERVLEGSFLFPLPQGAQVIRYALDINGKMREGVAVEKAQAAQVFESIERRRVDPGLLEKTEGNVFRTRIYPVPANGQRIIIIAFEQELLTTANQELIYHLPLQTTASIQKVAFHIQVSTPSRIPLLDSIPISGLSFAQEKTDFLAVAEKNNVLLQGALAIRLPAGSLEVEGYMQKRAGQNYFYLYTPLPSSTKEKGVPPSIAVIWDVSLSGLFRDTAAELGLLRAYLEKCGETTVHFYTLNHAFRLHGVFAIRNGNSEALLQAIRKLVYDGGTDYAKIRYPEVEETLLFSDGLSTLSQASPPFPPHPLYTITSASNASFDFLQAFAEQSAGAFINLKAMPQTAALERLTYQRLSFLGVKGSSGVMERYPAVLLPVQNGFTMAGTARGESLNLKLQFGYGRRVVVEKTVRLSQLPAGKKAVITL